MSDKWDEAARGVQQKLTFVFLCGKVKPWKLAGVEPVLCAHGKVDSSKPSPAAMP